MQFNTFPELIAQVRAKRQRQTSEAVGAELPLVALTWGYHIYSHANIPLRLTSAEDNGSASKLLRLLDVYASTAELVAQRFGVTLLEVQGKRLHFFLPKGGFVPMELTARMKDFSRALINVLYRALRDIAPEDVRGIRMASDYGESIILHVSTNSLVSLGPCACWPAKQLARDEGENYVMSGTLRYRDDRGRWKDEPLLVQEYLEKRISRDDFREFEEFASSRRTLRLQDIRFQYSAKDLRSVQPGTSIQPTVVQGFYVRPDLHAFTARTEAAFRAANRDVAIKSLINEFMTIVRHADSLITDFDKQLTIQLNWAGDCANFMVLCDDQQPYTVLREYLPSRIGAVWASEWEKTGSAWTTGVAGGGNGKDGGGRMLLASLDLQSGTFLIASGWPVGESLRAQESDGAKERETVVHEEDYRALTADHQNFYRQLQDRRFYAAKLTEMEYRRALASAASSLAYSRANIHVPKPHFK